ncbi:uncharacterized protein LOC144149462 [Haemaphysalis longicornis]
MYVKLEHYLYTNHVPDYFNYGTMGYVLGSELAEAIGVGALDANDSRRASWDSRTKSGHTTLLQCLMDKRSKLGFRELDAARANEQKKFMLTLSQGVRIAYRTLMRTFRLQAHTGKVFDQYWPEAQHVFFVRACMIWCSSETTAGPLTPREMCLLPLYSMKEFADRYNCANGGPFPSTAASGGFCAT